MVSLLTGDRDIATVWRPGRCARVRLAEAQVPVGRCRQMARSEEIK
jgi:hypothetical protein